MIVPTTTMFIHLIGFAYIVYAFGLIYVIQHLLNPKLRRISILSFAGLIIVGLEFMNFLLLHNPLSAFSHYFLILVHTCALAGVFELHAREQDPKEQRALTKTFTIGICSVVLGFGIAIIQVWYPADKLIHM
jgi:hypothetical protein